MLSGEPMAANMVADQPSPAVVLCGSFRREPDRLRADFEGLIATGCRILSPSDVDFVEEREGFVLTRDQIDGTPSEIEAEHLQAIEAADFVWFHAPGGYVGQSGALELGFAFAHGVPVFGRRSPRDVAFGELIETVGSPDEAVKRVSAGWSTPTGLFPRLQQYYRRVAFERGYDHETPQDSMLLLTEEVGELARAIRKQVGLVRESGYSDVAAVAEELADVQLYILHLANTLNIDMAAAVSDKEAINTRRFEERINRLSA